MKAIILIFIVNNCILIIKEMRHAYASKISPFILPFSIE